MRLHSELLGVPADPDVEVALDRAFAEARSQYPTVALAPEAFIGHVARHLPRGAPPLPALAAMDVPALFLCCACARGDAAAIVEVERSHFGKARAALRKVRSGATMAEDVEQRLRELLWSRGADGRAPHIVTYSGRGSLGNWIRTIAMRIALHIVDSDREIPSSHDLLSRAPGTGDPEVALIRAEYRARFKSTLEEALRSLPEDSRRDVRRYYFDATGVEAMAEEDGVAVSTVSRRLARAREILLRRTRELLERKHGIGARELDSLVAVVANELEITRSAIMENAGPPTG